MSAWRVTKYHIDVMVRGVVEQGGFWHRGKWCAVVANGKDTTNAMTANEVGRLLWRENYKSVNARYGERVRAPHYIYREPTRFLVDSKTKVLNSEGEYVPVRRMEPGLLAKQVACYDYQTCEHEGYKASKAFSIVLSLGRCLLSDVRGYEDAEWGI